MTNLRTWIQGHRLAWGFLLVGIFAILRAVQTWTWRQRFGSLDFEESLAFVLFLLLWFVILSVGLVGGGVVRLPQTSWQALGWRRQGLLKAIGLGLAGFVLLYVNVIAWAMLAGDTAQPAMSAPSPLSLMLAAFFAFGLPAWVEENLFRGYLQPLLAARVSLGLAIIMQAALFSAAHIGYLTAPLDFGMTLVAGLILGGLRRRDASLVAPYLAHGLFWMMAAWMPPAG
jgi:membrane protease YdiL (CAAX protease family)